MNRESIRKIVAIQAVEQADAEDRVLTDSDLRESASMAGAPLPENPDAARVDSFLAERAELLQVRASTRHPRASAWIARPEAHHRLGTLFAILLLVAAVIGYFTSELGPEKRINILSFPLLGILAWNLLVYLREAFLLLRGRWSRKLPASAEGLVGWLQASGGGPRRTGTGPSPADSPVASDETRPDPIARTLEAGRELFENRWARLTAPSWFARLKVSLHVVAVVLAASAIGAMYLKGLANEYRAVWESTFFTDSRNLQPFLEFVLGPAAALTGDEVPGVAELEALHWKAGESEVAGENAARWIHWYAITLGLFVLVPRLLLAAIWRGRVALRDRRLPFRSISPAYYDHLLAVSSGRSRGLHLVPYGLRPDSDRRRVIERALEHRLEGAVELQASDPITFGEEEDPPEQATPRDETLAPVMNFSATPERETHLALIESLRDRSSQPIPFLILDATEFDRRSEGFADAAKRREDREEAWSRLFSDPPLDLVVVSALDSN